MTAYRPSGLTVRYVAIAGLILAVGIAAMVWQRSQEHPRLVRAGYIPPASVFGLTNTRGVISSAYAYEAGLLGSLPVEDSDYLLGLGVQEPVRLPGGNWVRYTYYGSVYVQGSGWVSRWIAPGGGHFAYLHLASLGIGVAPRQKHTPMVRVRHRHGRRDDGELTAQVAARLLLRWHPAPGLGTVSGGTIVGTSGWPTDPGYGNGLAGPANSQLCWVADAAAAYWVYRIATGQIRPPKPRPFNLPLWWSYQRTHHYRHLLSPHDRHGRLLRAARAWERRARAYGGVVRKAYHAKSKRNRYAYTSWRFRCGQAWSWTRGRVKIQKARCLK